MMKTLRKKATPARLRDTESYGVFYWGRKKWTGPYAVFNGEPTEEVMKDYGSFLKKKVLSRKLYFFTNN